MKLKTLLATLALIIAIAPINAAIYTVINASTPQFAGDKADIAVWGNCVIGFDSKARPQYLPKERPISVPFLPSGCLRSGFFWTDSQGRFWEAFEATQLIVPGNDIYFIKDNGNYVRLSLPSGIPFVDFIRFITEKLVDTVGAIRSNKPLDIFFQTMGFPGISVSSQKAKPVEDPSKLY